MKISSKDLIDDLVKRTKAHTLEAESLKTHPLNVLNWKASPESWSVLECLEHLNLYGDFYIPELKRRLSDNSTQSKSVFKTGVLGNYFANTMLPKAKLNTMKTFADKNPNGSHLTLFAIDRFLGQQKEMLDILEKSRTVNLRKTRSSISISKIIKLSLGDTLRVVIYHNHRHLVQAQKTLEQARKHSA